MPGSDRHSVIEITDGIKVCCPPGTGLMTPYVLREQNDWFEDELRFLRTIVEPASLCLDIGANYGLYSFSLAKRCPDGQVWSYEPCAATADYLEAGIAANGFANIILSRAALSDRPGSGTLLTNRQSELNALVASAAAGQGETVALTTLDLDGAEYDWSEVDIVKIDAEGHEMQVLDGGRNFFATASPLVMCEIATGTFDLRPARRLVEFGYGSYRLVPGLMALRPQDLEQTPDSYQLNAFFCKPDRARTLLARNRLVLQPGSSPHLATLPADLWQGFLAAFPYGRTSLDWWRANVGAHPLEGWREYERALSLYALSRAEERDITTRYDALLAAYGLLAGLAARPDVNLPRMLSFARAAADLGERSRAVAALDNLLRTLAGKPEQFAVAEPFLSPAGEFEALDPGGNRRGWMIASALDSLERLRTHSSYFGNPQLTLVIVNDMLKLGFCLPHMQRRAELVRGRIQGAV